MSTVSKKLMKYNLKTGNVRGSLDESNSKTMKAKKRVKSAIDEEEITSTETVQMDAKKKNVKGGACQELHHKVLDVINQQWESRKKFNNKFLKKLSDVTIEMETDFNVLKDNVKHFEHVIGLFRKCLKQACEAYERKLITFEEICSLYKEHYATMDNEEKAQVDKLTVEIEKDMENLQKKLIAETKRSEWETLCKTIQAMGNNI